MVFYLSLAIENFLAESWYKINITINIIPRAVLIHVEAIFISSHVIWLSSWPVGVSKSKARWIPDPNTFIFNVWSSQPHKSIWKLV